jgi:hypothetical protein
MVRTGARALKLRTLLAESGLEPTPAAPPAPRLETLQSEYADEILSLFGALGGGAVSPSLRPGQWDLAFEGDLVVELDDELHFNRYRRLTLEPAWAKVLPGTTTTSGTRPSTSRSALAQPDGEVGGPARHANRCSARRPLLASPIQTELLAGNSEPSTTR